MLHLIIAKSRSFMDETLKPITMQEIIPLRKNYQRAKYAQWLIWSVLALEVVCLISGSFHYLLLQDLKAGKIVSPEAISANDAREALLNSLYFLIYIVSGITFIRWFRRAYYNLHLRTTYLAHKDNAAAYTWFVPILCLYKPLQIMKELYRETADLLGTNGVHHNLNVPNLNAWWTLWIIASLLGQFVFRYSLKAETLDELNLLSIVSLLCNLISILLAFVTLNVIKRYADIEPLLNQITEDSAQG